MQRCSLSHSGQGGGQEALVVPGDGEAGDPWVTLGETLAGGREEEVCRDTEMREMNFSWEICKEIFGVAGAKQRQASLKGSQSGQCRLPRPREGV